MGRCQFLGANCQQGAVIESGSLLREVADDFEDLFAEGFGVEMSTEDGPMDDDRRGQFGEEFEVGRDRGARAAGSLLSGRVSKWIEWIRRIE